MIIRRALRLALFGFALVAVTAAGFAGWLVSRMAPIGAAYAAKTLCSGVFVSGRAAEAVVREDILADNHPLLRLILPSLDEGGHKASATFLGMARRDAVFRPGLGCTLVIGSVTPNALASSGEEVVQAAVADAPTDDRIEGNDRIEGDARVEGDDRVETSDWVEAPPGPGVDGAKLEAAVDSAYAEPDAARLRRTRALLVVHDGRLIVERYAPGFSAQTPMLGWSMTKTVTGALIGALVKAGRLSLDNHALVPQWRSTGDPRAAITLDELLRMTSGLGFTEDHGDPFEDVALMLFTRADSAAYAIDKPLVAAPGTRWQYSSGTSNILSRIIRLAVGGERDYLQFPRRALFERIGMRAATIEPDSSGTLVTSSYMYAPPRDWARLGQFLLQDGVWGGERILPEGWVKYMTTLTPQSNRKDFGAHLWVKVPPPFDSVRNPRPQLPADAFHAVGHEGQFVSVIPSRKLVVVRLGLSRGEHVWDHAAFLERLLEAFP
jgi:CubicO group peptidase (beta-lactamase class C family)